MSWAIIFAWIPLSLLAAIAIGAFFAIGNRGERGPAPADPQNDPLNEPE